jgi:hypothetical protein
MCAPLKKSTGYLKGVSLNMMELSQENKTIKGGRAEEAMHNATTMSLGQPSLWNGRPKKWRFFGRRR